MKILNYKMMKFLKTSGLVYPHTPFCQSDNQDPEADIKREFGDDCKIPATVQTYLIDRYA